MAARLDLSQLVSASSKSSRQQLLLLLFACLGDLSKAVTGESAGAAAVASSLADAFALAVLLAREEGLPVQGQVRVGAAAQEPAACTMLDLASSLARLIERPQYWSFEGEIRYLLQRLADLSLALGIDPATLVGT